MHTPHRIASPTGGTVGGAGAAGGQTLSAQILSQGARYVKPLAEQAAQLAVKHNELAAWYRERAARWLESAHVSPWHSRQYFDHVDAAAWHERLAARHAQICAALEGATDGDA